LGYILFFLVPFLMITMDFNSYNVPAYVCFGTQVFILIGEFLQLMGGVGESFSEKLGTYFISVWNYIDLLHIICFMLFFSFWMSYASTGGFLHSELTTVEGAGLTIEQEAVITLIKAFMILLAISKCMYFSRIWYGMGKMVELVGRVLTTSMPFTLFFFGWVYVFSVLFIVLGYEIDRADFVGVNDLFVYFIQTYNNSIGNIAPPIYEGWMEHRMTHPKIVQTMTVLIWLFWFLNQFFVLIILLNFLVAIMGQAYEEIMTEALYFKYYHRAQLNKEARESLEFLPKEMNGL